MSKYNKIGKECNLSYFRFSSIPYGSPSWVGQCKPSCHSPEMMRKSSFIPLFDSGIQEINLTEGTLHLK